MNEPVSLTFIFETIGIILGLIVIGIILVRRKKVNK
jgi:flagellar biogenesis protein FliO